MSKIKYYLFILIASALVLLFNNPLLNLIAKAFIIVSIIALIKRRLIK